jgi:hypothetical protein
MRLSNKSTFSLACLILLLAFVAVPVMAHDATLGDDTNVHPGDGETDIANHDAHPVVKSITLKDAVNEYVGIDSFLVDITFEAANATNKITVPETLTADQVDVSGFTVVEVLKRSATLFEARLIRSTATSTGAAETISVLSGSTFIYTPPNADGDDADNQPDVGTEADMANPAKAVVIFDDTPASLPAFGETGGPEIIPLRDGTIPLTGEWAEPFRLTFTITGVDDATDLDFTADDTITFAAVPDTVTFSDLGRLVGVDLFGVTVTPSEVETTETAATSVEITISVKDKVGNIGTTTATVMLAPRQMSGPVTPPDQTDMIKPTLRSITAPAAPEGDGALIFIIEFSEVLSTTGANIFTKEDLVISNAESATLTIDPADNKKYNLRVVSENGDFPVKVEIKPGTMVDDAANNTSLELVAPAGTYTPEGVLGVEIDKPDEPEIDGTLEFTFKFAQTPSEIGAGMFTVTDIRVSNTDRDTLVLEQSLTDPMVYILTVTPSDPLMPVTVQLRGNSVDNGETGANNLVAGELSTTYTPPPLDTTPPTVTVTGTQGTDRAFEVTIAFSDDQAIAAGEILDDNEITVTGGTKGSVTPGTTANTYTVLVTPDHGVTSVTVMVSAGAVKDTSSNPSLAASESISVMETSPPVTGVTPPTVTITGTQGTERAFPVTIAFSDDQGSTCSR